jgi:hypothetical protein
MKHIFVLIAFLICQWNYAQISMTPELSQKLEGKEKLQDIKNTVLDHYNAELAKLSPRDSVARKSIMRQLKKWNRQFWMSEFYTNSDGYVENKTEVDLKGIEEVNQNFRPEISEDRNQPYPWTPQGPTNGDKGIGRFDKIAFHPTDPNIIFAGSPHGGLFKTINGGNSWDAISAFIPSLGISGIAINPTNPQIIYVLTGEANTGGYFGNDYISSSQGVFKTIDGGGSWLKTGPFPELENVIYRGTDLVMNPNNPEILIVSTTNGIFRTANGGQTWSLVSQITATDIALKPNDPEIVYCVNANTFFRSSNGGASFDTINTSTLLNNSNRISIGVTPANPSKVMLFCGPGYGPTTGIPSNTFKGIYQSTNSGSDNSFSIVTNTPNLFYNFIGDLKTNSGSGQSGYNNCIAISPTNQNEIYVGGLCVWKSTDGGVSWTQASAYWPGDDPYMHPDNHDLAYNPLNNSLYCANDGGVYKYNNGVWNAKFNGLTTSQFYHFERENDEGDIWGGAQDNGILEQNGGSNFYNYTTGDGYDVITDHNYLVENGNDDDVYLTQNSSIYADPGPLEISVPGNTSFFGNLAMNPEDEDVIYVGYSQRLYISYNRGSDWDSLGGLNAANWCLAVSRYHGGVLVGRPYAAGSNGSVAGLFKYTPNAVNITPPAPYTTALKITDIDIDPLNYDIVYISVAGTQPDAKVFMTTNGGTSWINLTFNLPNVPIFCIKKDGINGLYIGTSIGVFYKPPGNSHWQHFSNNLPQVPITEIELWPEPFSVGGIQPANGPPTPEIWISTFGRGIWKTNQYSPVCMPIVNLDNNYHAGPYLWEASNQLNSAKPNGGGVGTDVKYSAGNKIVLQDGFRAYYGTKFKTYIQQCGSEIPFDPVPLKVGDFYNGGIIFYFLQPGDLGYDPNVKHGLIASQSDIPNFVYQWAPFNSGVNNLQSAIGYGNSNSNLIANFFNGNTAYAAYESLQYVHNGFSDWYLPSKDELTKLYQNRNYVGGFNPNLKYWSSNFDNITGGNFYAWALNFSTGDLEPTLVGTTNKIRCIRSF